MRKQWWKNTWVLIILPFVAVICITGCQKDYSFEGSPTPIPDTLPVTSIDFPSCTSCKNDDSLALWSWKFKLDNAFLCGHSDTAIINIERSSFTFFGPSSCSIDSGLVITVYLNPWVLDSDRSNINAGMVAFYYYDHVGNSYILMSQPNTAFTLTIEDYNNQTGITIGKFSGYAYLANGNIATITEGRFKVKLR
ncbi:MAG TPA: hypothetical protein VJ499_15055 [Flavisolibacter sp.]|nr:hypothetical protein [Flavisolibacter sp.]